MKKTLLAIGVASLAFAAIASAATFNANLTVGSTGNDVVLLQNGLIAGGFSIPSISSGEATPGYFGSQTKSAVQAYQSARGIPNTGFVGPLTRAALNAGPASVGTACPAGFTCTANNVVTPVCPVGYTCTSNTTGTVTGGQVGISTPGVPGIMTVTSGPLSGSVLNVGAQMIPVEAIRVQAQYSDIDIQSLTLDLGNNTGIYNKIFNTLYVTDGTNILATQPLNGSTVVQSGSEYILGIAGFHFLVPKGTYKDIIIKGSLNSSIDSSYISSGTSGTHYPGNTNPVVASNSLGAGNTASSGWGIGVVTNGVRGVDGAGLNLYGPTSLIAQNLTINASLVDNATANVSLDFASPLTSTVPVTDTVNNQYLGLPVLIFDVNAQYDTLHIHDVKVSFVTTGPGTISAAYLYQGSTPIQSASVQSGIADFSNITDGTNGALIPVNTTLPYTVKVDVTGVTSATTITASTTSGISVYSSNDSSASPSGIAAGNTQTVSGVGPLFVLSGSPTITSKVISTDTSGNATSSYSAVFNVSVTAVGKDVNFGLAGSSTPMFSVAAPTGNATTSLAVYKNGSIDYSSTLNLNGLSNYDTNSTVTASYSQPTNTTVSTDGKSFTLAQNQNVTIPVTFTWLVKNPGANTYAAQMQGINYEVSGSAKTTTTFMAGQTAWRTPSTN
jgi:hypothetical protein